MPSRDPLLPKWLITTIAVVVVACWAMSVVAAVIDRNNSATLLPVTGVLTAVIGAGFGIGFRNIGLRAEPRNDEQTEAPREDTKP